MLRLFTTLSIAILLSIGHVQAEEIVENNLPLFVTITAKWCTSCQSLKPIVEELEYEYQGKVRFLTLDNSSKQTIDESLEKAEKEDIKWFYEKNKATLPIVGVFCGAKDTAIKEFQAQTEKGIYQAYLDNLVINGTQICSLK
ncbi:MAG: thioredoxin family protein [Candidatus Melainabacteria bacterium]|nr:thioredoxin family protein [Candidatus Melainabacteria bacterium]